MSYLVGGWPYIPNADIVAMCRKRGEAFTQRFGELSEGQTMSVEGPYPYDVEAVLVRMRTGRLTGTQAFWD